MEWKTTLLIILGVMIVLFVPFYPFKMVKRLVFFLLNKFVFVYLKIAFDDIGGVPIVGIRLFNVRINLKGQSTLEARELRLRINLWRILLLRRPTVDPVTLFEPKIYIVKEKEQGDVWFLLPFTIAKKVVGLLFSSLWGLNKVRIHNGEITIHGAKGDTTISNLNGLFYSLGAGTSVRFLSCRIGEGSIEMSPASHEITSDIKVTIRNLHLDDLVALKIPKTLTGVADIDATMKGGFGPVVMEGEMRSAVLYLREQPIRNFQAPLHFEGTTLLLSPMRGEIADYHVNGSLENDVETDRVHLKLRGTGTGRGPALIFKMLNMKPYINSGEIDARIDLEGDFETFNDISGEIVVRLRDARLSPDSFSEKSKPGRALPRVPELNFDMFMQEGSLYIDSVEIFLPGSRIRVGGRIDMTLDEELEKVTETYYEIDVGVKRDRAMNYRDDVNTLTLPAEFAGKLKLKTKQRNDPSDFYAKGSVELKDVTIQGEKLPLLNRLGNSLDVFFGSISSDLDITAERARLSDTRIDAMWLHVLAGGDIGFNNGELDIEAAVRVVSDYAGEASGLLSLPLKLASRLKARVKITGTFKNPRIQLLGREQWRSPVQLPPGKKPGGGTPE